MIEQLIQISSSSFQYSLWNVTLLSALTIMTVAVVVSALACIGWVFEHARVATGTASSFAGLLALGLALSTPSGDISWLVGIVSLVLVFWPAFMLITGEEDFDTVAFSTVYSLWILAVGAIFFGWTGVAHGTMVAILIAVVTKASISTKAMINGWLSPV